MPAEKKPSFVEATERVRDLATEISYSPTDAERELKALFQVALEENPLCDWDTVTAAAVEQVTGDSRVHKWWGKPGFQSWFCNKHEFRARSEFILNKLLDSFMFIALSDDPKSFGAKVQAAKVLADITNKVPKGVKVKVLDSEIPDNPAEIRALIQQLEAQASKEK